MSNQHTGGATAATSPKEIDFEQEVRFAVVMYGGVSLAVYMNGITQELFHLVKATAPDPTHPERVREAASGTEKVYRKLGRILGRGAPRLEGGGETGAVRSRFIVDVLSGTSAGGINGVFLAKALANAQSIDQLTELWENEGAIESLINDKDSTNGTDLKPAKPPRALLNGDRMYLRLLEAFSAMDEAQDRWNPKKAQPAPYVDQVDLFVTTTDVEGLDLSLGLADKLVIEKRYKKVFHLQYDRQAQNGQSGQDGNDLTWQMNPFLAYASRCTSSFPFAFDPMRLDAIDALLPRVDSQYRARYADVDSKDGFGSKATRWQKFFCEYFKPTDVDPSTKYARRAYGDGGYLDNKPFGYAIDELAERRSDYPIARKLIYIEPSPEEAPPASSADDATSPNVIENVTAALTLPSYETIREDLQRVLRRNRLIERVRRITAGLEQDVKAATGLRRPVQRVATSDDWKKKTLKELIVDNGSAYGGYHRLRVGAATDELARILTSAADFKEQSDEFWAIRMLVGQWRARTFTDSGTGVANAVTALGSTETAFLYWFDLDYMVRRLAFVRGKIEELNNGSRRNDILASLPDPAPPPPTDLGAFHSELLALKQDIDAAFDYLLVSIAALKSSKPDAPIASLLGSSAPGAAVAAQVTKDDLDRILMVSEAKREDEAKAMLNGTPFQARVNILLAQVATAFENIATNTSVKVRFTAPTDPSRLSAHTVVTHFYDAFDSYDMIRFPIFYSTEVGEAVPVDVIRFSPDDAESLIGRDSERKKLAGQSLFHFGAFLEKSWRTNDVLWGRLDGAERIIGSLLPGDDDELKKVRDSLIEEAQLEIFGNFVERERATEVADVVSHAIASGPDAKERQKGLRRFFQTSQQDVRRRIDTILRACLEPSALRAYYGSTFSVDLTPNTERALKSLSRAVTVVGEMLKGLTTDSALAQKPGIWLARIGRLMWGFVEVSVPGSILRQLFRHASVVTGICALLLVVVGIFFNFGDAQRVGWIVLGALLALNVGSMTLGAYLTGRNRILLALKVLGIALVVLLAATGAGTIVRLAPDWWRAATAWFARWKL